MFVATYQIIPKTYFVQKNVKHMQLEKEIFSIVIFVALKLREVLQKRKKTFFVHGVVQLLILTK